MHDVLIVEVGSPTFGLMIEEDTTVQSVWIMVCVWRCGWWSFVALMMEFGSRWWCVVDW